MREETAGIRRILFIGLGSMLVVGVGLGLYLSSRGSPRATRRGSVLTTTATRRGRRQRPARRLRGRHDRPVPILMYHVVGRAPRTAAFPSLYVSRRDFASQLRWLDAKGYHAVTLRAVYRYWGHARPLPPKPIVLSFDDGYREQFTIARPLLEHYGWPGVLDLEYGHLVHENLTGGMIRAMLADGWELASHTLTHPDLTQVSPARLRREVARSRQLLERRFGVRVAFFCYPSGRIDARVVNAVRAAGYLGATTIRPGLARPHELFRLARIRVDAGDGPRRLAKKLAEAA